MITLRMTLTGQLCELYTASKALGKDGDSYYKDIKDYGDAFTVLSTLEGGENNGSFRFI